MTQLEAGLARRFTWPWQATSEYGPPLTITAVASAPHHERELTEAASPELGINERSRQVDDSKVTASCKELGR